MVAIFVETASGRADIWVNASPPEAEVVFCAAGTFVVGRARGVGTSVGSAFTAAVDAKDLVTANGFEAIVVGGAVVGAFGATRVLFAAGDATRRTLVSSTTIVRTTWFAESIAIGVGFFGAGRRASASEDIGAGGLTARARSPCAVAALLIICFTNADAFGLFGWIGFDVSASAFERFRVKGVGVVGCLFEYVHIVDFAVTVVILGVAGFWRRSDLAFAYGFPITPSLGGFFTILFPCFAVSKRSLGGRIERLWGACVARERCLFWMAGAEFIDQPVAIVVLEVAADL